MESSNYMVYITVTGDGIGTVSFKGSSNMAENRVINSPTSMQNKNTMFIDTWKDRCWVKFGTRTIIDLDKEDLDARAASRIYLFGPYHENTFSNTFVKIVCLWKETDPDLIPPVPMHINTTNTLTVNRFYEGKTVFSEEFPADEVYEAKITATTMHTHQASHLLDLVVDAVNDRTPFVSLTHQVHGNNTIGITVNKYRNLQSFTVFQCEPKMFFTCLAMSKFALTISKTPLTEAEGDDFNPSNE